jgi:hypothetical protein
MSLGRWRQGALLVLGGFFCYLVFCEFFFVTHAMRGIFRPLSHLVLIPAARAQHEHVAYASVVELAHGMRAFGNLEKRKQAFDQALSVSVHRLYIRKLADELGVRVTNEDVQAYPIDLPAIQSDLEAAGWNVKDYQKYIVEPLLLAQKTEMAVSLQADYQTQAHEAMGLIRKKLDLGLPFADAAQNFSQDPSAPARGDLGIMSMDTVPAWLLPATSLAVGETSEVLEAPDALWTVTLLEFYPSEVPEQAAVHFRGIAVKKTSFNQILQDRQATHPVWVFVW